MLFKYFNIIHFETGLVDMIVLLPTHSGREDYYSTTCDVPLLKIASEPKETIFGSTLFMSWNLAGSDTKCMLGDPDTAWTQMESGSLKGAALGDGRQVRMGWSRFTDGSCSSAIGAVCWLIAFLWLFAANDTVNAKKFQLRSSSVSEIELIAYGHKQTDSRSRGLSRIFHGSYWHWQ